MDAKVQRRVQRYGWDKTVDVYERYWRDQLEPAQALMLEMAAIRPGERVVDVACGTGLVTFRAAEAVGPSGTVIGADLSGKMVEQAAAEAARRGVGHARFARMDAEALDLPEGAADVALCALGLMYVPEPERALAEMRRVLVEGGRVAVAVWGARRGCGWAEIFPIVDARVESDVCPLFFRLGTGETLPDALEAAGLRDVRSRRITTTLRYAAAADAVGAAFAGGPVALAHDRFDDATRESAYAEYLASIEPYRDGEAYEIPGEFVVASGLK
jgi:ubiquinone/menaquinone biosynthesis C-methylase UbiE